MKRAVAVVALALSSLAPRVEAQAPKKPAAVAAPKKPAAPVVIVAVTGASVHTGTGEVIEDATIVIENGVIKDVGKNVATPAGAETVAAKGMVVTPGLVDVMTGIGLVEVDLEDATHEDIEQKPDRIRAGFRASDGYNPSSPVIAVARSEGLTSAGVIPHGGLFSGLSAWVDLDGATADEAIVLSPLALHVHIKPGAAGDGHAQAIARIREAFDDARTFVKNRAAWERNQSRAFSASRLDLEALASALDKKLPVVFDVNRAADILTALKVSKEFNLKPVIAGGAEAWRVSGDLAAAKVPVVIFPLVDGPENFDSIAARDDNAARLVKAGVTVVISTAETHNARKLRQVAGNAVRAGMPYEAAIQAITRAPAEAFGLGAKYGTLQKGKVANLVVWSADPLELSTKPVAVLVRGKKMSLRTRQTELFEKYRRLPPR